MWGRDIVVSLCVVWVGGKTWGSRVGGCVKLSRPVRCRSGFRRRVWGGQIRWTDHPYRVRFQSPETPFPGISYVNLVGREISRGLCGDSVNGLCIFGVSKMDSVHWGCVKWTL